MGLLKFIRFHRTSNSKLLFYINGLGFYLTPKFILKRKLKKILARLEKYNSDDVLNRVDYYNKLKDSHVYEEMEPLSQFKYSGRHSAYFFDAYEFTRYFADNLKIAFRFGDITDVKYPAITKSRPLNVNNADNVLLKLDKSRHFVFLKDKKPFAKKKNMLIGRGDVYQPHRIKFYEMYFGHALCDLGKTNKESGNPAWIVPPMPKIDHLDYKFILCLEGNDVATNLKWVMSSNSVAVMPKPKYETWFMEGKLVGGKHYIEIKDDYSDVEEKLRFYIDNPGEAQKIIENAHAWVDRFKDKKREELISVLVLQKYFKQTGQI